MKAKLMTLVTVAGLALASCTPDWATQDQSAVIFKITKITATAGTGGTGGDTLISDICCPVVNDNASITMTASAKKAGTTLTSIANDVLLDRYEVVYIRSDGHNVEGVDVPYRISGPLSGHVAAGAETTSEIIVVRHSAKLEPPLWNLRDTNVLNTSTDPNGTFQLGGAGTLTVIAEITVYGRTIKGDGVRDTGRLQITFVDIG